MSFVFTGDIGREAEQDIASRFKKAPIRILKVPHHGSATSSTPLFLDAVQPRWAIVQAGYRNRFGHPAATVLSRYAERAVAVARSDG